MTSQNRPTADRFNEVLIDRYQKILSEIEAACQTAAYAAGDLVQNIEQVEPEQQDSISYFQERQTEMLSLANRMNELRGASWRGRLSVLRPARKAS